MSALMDIANKFLDGEYAYHNNQTRSPKDERSQRYNSQKHRTRNYDEYKGSRQVAVGFRSNNGNQGDEHQSSGTAMTTKMNQVPAGSDTRQGHQEITISHPKIS
jgi:hypothetical protein